jgi:RNA polymerase sigma-70 factor (ECF subfamily)
MDISNSSIPIPNSSKEKELSLDELVEACIQKDRVSQEKLYKMYYGKMMGLCMRLFSNRDDAKEALNLGFLKVYNNLSQYNGHGSLEAWIYKIIYRTAIDQIRKMGIFQKRYTEITEETATVEADVLQQMYVQNILSTLGKLPEATRIVFNLYAIENYKHAEIAKELGISEGTSKWHVNQARTILRKTLTNLK